MEISLKTLLYAILKKAWLIALVTILITIIAFAVFTTSIEDEYTSSAQIYVKVDSSGGITNPSTSTLNYIESLIANTFVVLKGPNFAKEVLAKINKNNPELEISIGEIQKSLSLMKTTATSIFSISANHSNAKTAEIIATNASESVNEYMLSLDRSSLVFSVFQEANLPTSPSNGSQSLISTIVAFLLVALVSVIIVIMQYSATQLILFSDMILKATKNNKILGTIELDTKKYKKYVMSFDVLACNTLIAVEQPDDNNTESCIPLVITCTNEKEEIDYTVLNLATSIAKLGKKVLVVDVNSDAKLSESLAINNGNGVSNACNADFVNNLITKTQYGYDFVTYGNGSNVPNVLSDNISKLYSGVKENYDYILLRCPALNNSSVTHNMSETFKNLILSTQYYKTSAKQLTADYNSLQYVGYTIVGTIYSKIKNNKYYTLIK